jgi:hypothetical protein
MGRGKRDRGVVVCGWGVFSLNAWGLRAWSVVLLYTVSRSGRMRTDRLYIIPRTAKSAPIERL